MAGAVVFPLLLRKPGHPTAAVGEWRRLRGDRLIHGDYRVDYVPELNDGTECTTWVNDQ